MSELLIVGIVPVLVKEKETALVRGKKKKPRKRLPLLLMCHIPQSLLCEVCSQNVCEKLLLSVTKVIICFLVAVEFND